MVWSLGVPGFVLQGCIPGKVGVHPVDMSGACEYVSICAEALISLLLYQALLQAKSPAKCMISTSTIRPEIHCCCRRPCFKPSQRQNTKFTKAHRLRYRFHVSCQNAHVHDMCQLLLGLHVLTPLHSRLHTTCCPYITNPQDHCYVQLLGLLHKPQAAADTVALVAVKEALDARCAAVGVPIASAAASGKVNCRVC